MQAAPLDWIISLEPVAWIITPSPRVLHGIHAMLHGYRDGSVGQGWVRMRMLQPVPPADVPTSAFPQWVVQDLLSPGAWHASACCQICPLPSHRRQKSLTYSTISLHAKNKPGSRSNQSSTKSPIIDLQPTWEHKHTTGTVSASCSFPQCPVPEHPLSSIYKQKPESCNQPERWVVWTQQHPVWFFWGWSWRTPSPASLFLLVVMPELLSITNYCAGRCVLMDGSCKRTKSTNQCLNSYFFPHPQPFPKLDPCYHVSTSHVGELLGAVTTSNTFPRWFSTHLPAHPGHPVHPTAPEFSSRPYVILKGRKLGKYVWEMNTWNV